MKAVAAALEQMPRFNSSLSEDGQRLTLKKHQHRCGGGSPNGLVVPVFKDVNKKGIIELSRELMTISKKARDGKLTAAKCRAVASPSPASAAWVYPFRADCERAGSGYPRRFQVRDGAGVEW
ncbi:2-oxo acid dehydrogenase subunit E2 [Escherichia coli]